MRALARTFLWLAWTFLIFLTTTAPGGSTGSEPPLRYDLIAHFLWFGIFYLLVLYVLASWPSFHSSLKMIIALVLALSYAGLVEYLQMHIPGRSASALDLCAGAIGVTVAMIFSRRFI